MRAGGAVIIPAQQRTPNPPASSWRERQAIMLVRLLVVAAITLPAAPSVGWQVELDLFFRSAALAEPNGVIIAGSAGNLATGHDLAVTKLRASNGTIVWASEINGTANDGDHAHDVAIDSTGRVAVVGLMRNLGFAEDFVALQLSGTTGLEQWRSIHRGSAGLFEEGRTVAINSRDEVVVAGYLGNAPTGTKTDIAVFTLSDANGTTIWGRVLDGGANSGDEFLGDVAIDANDDVIVAGYIVPAASGSDFAILKFAGGTGDELWRYVVDGGGGSVDLALSVMIDASGDVIATGGITDAANVRQSLTVRLAGDSGTELWRHTIPNGTVFDMDNHPSGDIIAAGSSGGAQDFLVLRLDSATGAEVWRYQIDGGAMRSDRAESVSVDPSGDILATGFLVTDPESTSDAALATIKLSGETGDELWRRLVEGTAGGFDQGHLVMTDSSGDVFVVGTLQSVTNGEHGEQTVVIKLNSDGLPHEGDNCPDAANPGQEDTDGDLIGDACDPDTDGDGVFDDGGNNGTRGDQGCLGGENENCDDNCRFVQNPLQEDSGGRANGPPDGIGDVCQCGDVTGDGKYNSADATMIKRNAIGLSAPLFNVPGNCDVTGDGKCNSGDATMIKRKAIDLAAPLFISQKCPNYTNGPPQGACAFSLLDADGNCDFEKGPDAACTHELCEFGSELEAACDPCVALICAVDLLCCASVWDRQCIEEVKSVCELDTCIPIIP